MPPVPPPNADVAAAAAHGHAGPLPLLDLAVLRDLEDHLDVPLVRNFASDYVGMWEYRCRRLAEAVARPDGAGEALDAVISLKVTSHMIGGLRLAGLAGTLEDQIRKGALRESGVLLSEIRECGQGTVQAIRRRYCGQA